MPDEPNILELNPPPTTQMVERVRFFAKALAYGVVHGLWSPIFIEVYLRGSGRTLITSGSRNYHKQLNKYLHDVWKDNQPDISFLESFEYLRLSREFRDEDGTLDTVESGMIKQHILTQKAYALLETPDAPPNVFISYRRNGSAAAALLVAYHLKMAGVQPFIDMEMNVGVDWEPHLKERVWGSKYFVCLIGAKTHLSLNVANEAQWAWEAAESKGLEIIPLFQPDFIRNDNEVYPEWFEYLLSKNGIPVSAETPLDYKFALDRLLNRVGYTPL